MTSYIERGSFGKTLSFMGAEHELEDFIVDDEEMRKLNEVIEDLRRAAERVEAQCEHGLPLYVCMICADGQGSDYA